LCSWKPGVECLKEESPLDFLYFQRETIIMTRDFEVQKGAGNSGEPTAAYFPRSENLAMLYQGMLTGLLRVQSGRQQIMDSETFRRRIKASLSEINRDAGLREFSSEEIDQAHFAIVAFLDEAVLTSNDPSVSSWGKKSLQEELFGQAHAGEDYFRRLDELMARRDSPHLADILEVYLLCLLLGYEGHYALRNKAELHMLIDEVRQRVDRIRGHSPRFSPEVDLPMETTSQPAVDLLTKQLRLFAIVTLAFALFCFMVFRVHLIWKVDDLQPALKNPTSVGDK
jgi:type VI secretion system protein ImpK